MGKNAKSRKQFWKALRVNFDYKVKRKGNLVKITFLVFHGPNRMTYSFEFDLSNC